MLEPPMTKEQALKLRYSAWAGFTKGFAYHPGRCAWEVWPTDGWMSYQCQRAAKYGPDNLYCKQHAKRVKVQA